MIMITADYRILFKQEQKFELFEEFFDFLNYCFNFKHSKSKALEKLFKSFM